MTWIGRIAVLLFTASVWAGFGEPVGCAEVQDLPLKSEGTLRFFVDLSAFRGPEGYTRQEVDLLLDAKQLRFSEHEDGPVGKVSIVALVLDTLATQVAHKTWVRLIAIQDLDEGFVAPFKDVVRFDLKPGVYRLIVHMKDINAEKEGRCTASLHVPDYEQAGLVFSDLQLASQVARSGETHRFVKQGWKVVPNITRNYVTEEPIQVYFELYNLAVDQVDQEESFILGYRLMDVEGSVVRTYPAKRFLKPGESCVKAEILETEGLEEGMYHLQVEAFDGSSKQYLRIQRSFFLVSKDLPQGLSQIQKDLIRYYGDIRYLADPKTWAVYEALEEWPSRLVFLKAFWGNLDDSPDSGTNERLIQHLVRMHYVETHFGAGSRLKGSETDRGRVYIQYGQPDDMDYHTSAAGGKPFEVWIYETQRRYEFVFRDRRGTGVYELVHSTYPGELSNPYWGQEF
ncbi:MAG: GWxTD domain-containing protein [bacterium]|nr:GWxTD domain-containing protein [bacterium]